jgi:uncharacterized protein
MNMHNLVKWLICFIIVIAMILLVAGMYFFHVAQVRDPKANQPDVLRTKLIRSTNMSINF